ncbi:MAG: ABC transporter substrate-binding protein [Aestuariivirga sp.]
MKTVTGLMAAMLALGISATATKADPVPDAPKFDAQGKVTMVGIGDILEYKALPSYNEPEFMKALEKAGKLPALKDRLPKEPMVYKTGNMKDGIGVYGDVMRHVIGGRPDGWNYSAGQSQGWGGIDIGLSECLTRTGPLFQVKAEDLQPLPNLAKSWDWSKDGMQLTMHLIEGAKWSDGVPFSSDDVMFYWEKNVLDTNVHPLNGANPGTFGEGTTLEKVDANTIKWTFKTAFPTQVLYAMAYGTFCPGPAHILAPQHPANSKNTYDQYKNAFPPTYSDMPTMGAWAEVDYKPDNIIVLRRNPYYWKVDEKGNQLPYLNEMQYRLSTWADRDVQTIAGTGDFSNLEQPENFVESLKKSADPAAPARLEFGQRTIGYALEFNYSANGWGDNDANTVAIHNLNRNLNFRKGITSMLDRQRLGESLVKGPFTAIYPGGLFPGTSFYDKASTVYYPFNLDAAKADFAAAGLKDTDGDGILNFPKDVNGGKNVEITLLGNADYQSDKSLVEGVVAMGEKAGIRVIPKLLGGKDHDAARDAGKYDWEVLRQSSEMVTAVQQTDHLAPIGPNTTDFHKAGTDGKVDMMDFEQKLVDIVNKFIGAKDSKDRVALMKEFQKISTENVYKAGLTVYPGALLINKRFSNVAPGAPIFMYNWAEDNIIRERVFVAADKQSKNELFPDTLPGKPGSAPGEGLVK